MKNLKKTKTLKNKTPFKPCNRKEKEANLFVLLAVGAGVGFVNGFWGGGGGMLCVPALTMLLGFPEKRAHATAIFIMLPLSIASFIVYACRQGILWGAAGIITAGFVAGGVVGALLLKKMNNFVLKIIFTLIMVAAGIRLLF